MFSRPKLLVVLTLAAGAGVAAGAALLVPSFQLAPAGTAIPHTVLALPPVMWVPGQQIPAGVYLQNGFTPGVERLTTGEVVITNERAMRYVWRILFAAPYDASLFDFHNSFVVLMGGGTLDIGSFSITAVEEVAAEYQGTFLNPGHDVDRFLAVTATTFFPGNPPQFTPPPYYALAAVRIPKSFQDDVVFHRNVFAAP